MLTKMKSQNEEELEIFKGGLRSKFEKELDDMEKEKLKLKLEIEEGMRTENSKFGSDVQAISEETERLETQIGQAKDEIETETQRLNALNSEINQAQRSLIKKRSEMMQKARETSKIHHLKDELARVQLDIKTAENEYRVLQEKAGNESSDIDSDLNNRLEDSSTIKVISEEISDIKALIDQQPQQPVHEIEPAQENIINQAERVPLPLGMQIREEKRAIKNEQKKLEREKQKWKEDKTFLERNPSLQSDQKMETMNAVKGLIEEKIDELNNRIRSVKDKEKLMKGQIQSLSNISEGRETFPRNDSDGDMLGDFSSDKAFQNRWQHLL